MSGYFRELSSHEIKDVVRQQTPRSKTSHALKPTESMRTVKRSTSLTRL